MTVTTTQVNEAVAALAAMPEGRKRMILRRIGIPFDSTDADIRANLSTMNEIPGMIIPPDPIIAARAQKKAAVDSLYVQKTMDVGATCPTSFGVAQCDDSYPLSSRSVISGAVLMATIALGAGKPFSQAWSMADNTMVTFDGPNMIKFGLEVGHYVGMCFANKQALKASIASATTVDDITALNIATGWPPVS